MTSYLPMRNGSAVGDADVGAPVDVRTGRVDASAVSQAQPVRLTPQMVDQAVDRVTSDQKLGPEVAQVMQTIMGRHVDGPVSSMYFNSQAAADRAAAVGISKEELAVHYVLSDDEVIALTDYAPEYRLRFYARDQHDHAVAAATRVIDRKLIRSRLPHGVAVSDIGGNPLLYVDNAIEGVHVCGEELDVKDAMRYKLRQMRARVIEKTSKDVVKKGLARSYLAKDEHLVCGKRAQECVYRTPLLTSIHVYDIPLQDWPGIMAKKGAVMVEGCLNFSDRFFDELQGELGVSGVRYEIDVVANTISMGFKDSPAWWYQHRFSDYLRYGQDHVITTEYGAYAYKVVERRGDTLFFRILKVDGTVDAVRSHTYKEPGVPMVLVHGFELNSKGGKWSDKLLPKDYCFPKNLWFEMVSQAAEDFERGVMDYSKMYNHYRTVSVRHTINAVLVMGGEQVSANELVPLVVHSCLAAAAQCVLGQRVTRGMTESALLGRVRRNEGTGRKVISALLVASKAVVFSPLLPFRYLSSFVGGKAMDELEKWLVTWEPQYEIVTRPISQLVGLAYRSAAETADYVMKKAAVEQAPFDHFAAVAADPRLLSVLKEHCPQVAIPEHSVPSSQLSETVVASVGETEVSADTEDMRRRAIREHIEESRLQNRAVTSTCHTAFSVLTKKGEPDKVLLQVRGEAYRAPDFWLVRNGVLVKSFSGLGPESFRYSAVYSPRPDPITMECLRSVYREDWVGSGTVDKPEHVNYVMDDKEFSGWVLVTMDLVVHNGPDIIKSLEDSLKLPHQYSVRLNWGPPGCGKTYSIIHAYKAPDVGVGLNAQSDVVMCPVRESADDTRDRLKEIHESGNLQSDIRFRKVVRTLDSYLTNVRQKHDSMLRAQRLLADECFMAHAGKWYAAAALLGVSEVWAYGDDQQIPHIPRVQAPKMYVKLAHEVKQDEFLTRRCPATAVAAWGEVYDWKVRSLSSIKTPLIEVSSTKGREIPEGCVMMCMYQNDKVELERMYSADRKRVKIMTAHEAEGKTFAHVWLHRFDNRKRLDNMSLFDQKPHVLVAMSRHTQGFLYRRPADLGDLVSVWITKSKDPRRVAAAADVESAGKSMEFV